MIGPTVFAVVCKHPDWTVPLVNGQPNKACHHAGKLRTRHESLIGSSPGEKTGEATAVAPKPIPAGEQAGQNGALAVLKDGKKKDEPEEGPDLGTFWGLLILGLAYVHHSTSGSASVLASLSCLGEKPCPHDLACRFDSNRRGIYGSPYYGRVRKVQATTVLG